MPYSGTACGRARAVDKQDFVDKAKRCLNRQRCVVLNHKSTLERIKAVPDEKAKQLREAGAKASKRVKRKENNTNAMNSNKKA